MAVWVKEKQAGSGIWWVFRKSRLPDGRIIRTSKRCKSKKAAEQLAEKASGLEAAIKMGLPTPEAPPPDPGPTLKEFVTAYLARVAPDAGRPDAGLKVSTIKDYRSCLESRLLPLLGEETRISAISSRDVKALKATLEAASNRKGRRRGQKLSRRNVEKHLRVLSAVLGDAVDAELIPLNPVSTIGKGRTRSSRERHAEEKRRVDALSEVELTTLLATAEAHAIERAGKTVYPFRKHADLLLMLADSGVRIGEALALQWGDVAWQGDYAHVRRAYTCGAPTRVARSTCRRAAARARCI
jgi:integrase